MRASRTLVLLVLAAGCGSSSDPSAGLSPVTGGSGTPAAGRQVVDSGVIGGPATPPSMPSPTPMPTPTPTPAGDAGAPSSDGPAARPEAATPAADAGADRAESGTVPASGCSAATPRPASCDPLAQNCGPGGLGCYPAGASGKCQCAGTTATGNPCLSDGDCVAGAMCAAYIFNGITLQACRQMCDLGSPACPARQTCTAPGAGTRLGYCMPQ